MLKSLTLENFTVFKDASFEFSEGVNVIVGENGSGKSHLLKVVYSGVKYARFSPPKGFASRLSLDIDFKAEFQELFRFKKLGNLISRHKDAKKFDIDFDTIASESQFSIKMSKTGREIGGVEDAELSDEVIDSLNFIPSLTLSDIAKRVIYLLPNEILSYYPGFVQFYKKYNVRFDLTWYDLAYKLGSLTLKEPEKSKLYGFVKAIEKAMQGKIIQENNEFYFIPYDDPDNVREITLIAEGIRKLGQLAYLILNEEITENTVLIWDEPEANLNPKLLAPLAKIIYDMPKYGIQVFVATHSLFLLRELYILQETDKKEGKPIDKPVKYFGLAKNEAGFAEVSTGDDFVDLNEIAVLDAQLEQSDRYEALF